MRWFYLFFLFPLLSLTEAKELIDTSNGGLDKETTGDLVNTLGIINQDSRNFGNTPPNCNCNNQETSFGKKIIDNINNRLNNTTAKGVSVGIDAHIGPAGINWSMEHLQFGNSITPPFSPTSPISSMIISLLTSPKGVKHALYCVGGVGGAADASISAGFNQISTFGRCNSPGDYSGGFLNIGVQGNILSGSLSAQLSIGFNMGKFLSLLESKFRSEEKRQRLRNQIIQLTAAKIKSTIEKNHPMIKFIQALLFPKEAKPFSEDETKIINIFKIQYNGDVFKYLIEDFKNHITKIESSICNTQETCLDSNAEELKELMSLINESIGHCHGLSAGMSFGSPALGSIISTTINYSDFILIGTADLNIYELGEKVISFASKQGKKLWMSSTSACSDLENPDLSQEDIDAMKKDIYKIIKTKLSPQIYKRNCLENLMDSMKNTARVASFLILE